MDLMKDNLTSTFCALYLKLSVLDKIFCYFLNFDDTEKCLTNLEMADQFGINDIMRFDGIWPFGQNILLQTTVIVDLSLYTLYFLTLLQLFK